MCSQERSCAPTGSPAGPDQRMKNRSLQTGRAYGLPSKTPPPPPDPTRWQGCRNGGATWRVSWPSSPTRRLPGRARAELRSEAEPQPPIHRRRCAMPMGPHPQSGPHTPPAPTMRPSAGLSSCKATLSTPQPLFATSDLRAVGRHRGSAGTRRPDPQLNGSRIQPSQASCQSLLSAVVQRPSLRTDNQQMRSYSRGRHPRTRPGWDQTEFFRPAALAARGPGRVAPRPPIRRLPCRVSWPPAAGRPDATDLGPCALQAHGLPRGRQRQSTTDANTLAIKHRCHGGHVSRNLHTMREAGAHSEGHRERHPFKRGIKVECQARCAPRWTRRWPSKLGWVLKGARCGTTEPQKT